MAKNLGVFVTAKEREAVEANYKTSGMVLTGGMPMGDPQQEVEKLVEKYNMPRGTGMNLKTGEFVSP